MNIMETTQQLNQQKQMEKIIIEYKDQVDIMQIRYEIPLKRWKIFNKIKKKGYY